MEKRFNSRKNENASAGCTSLNGNTMGKRFINENNLMYFLTEYTRKPNNIFFFFSKKREDTVAALEYLEADDIAFVCLISFLFNITS